MRQKEIDISVAVAIYNIEKYLRPCLESLLGQDYDSCEFILVDDGSTDSSGEICDEYAKKDDRFRAIHKKNEGAVSARRTGIENAKGRYIYFVDGDDWVDAGLLSTLMRNQKAYHADVLVFPYYQSYKSEEYRADNPYVGLMTGESLTSFKKKFISQGKLYHFGMAPAMWNKLYEKEKIQELYTKIPSNITIGEDFAATVPYIMKCNSILFVDTEQAYHYRIRNDSMTHKYDSKLVDKVTNLKVYFDTLEFPPEIDAQMDKYWAMIATMLIDNQMSGSTNAAERRNIVMKMYEIPQLLEAVSRVPRQDYTFRFKVLLYPFLRKNYAALFVMHRCDVEARKMLGFLAAVQRKRSINKIGGVIK